MSVTSKIYIHYGDENFGEISIFLNDIFFRTLSKNSELNLVPFKGENSLKIKVTGSDFDAWETSINDNQNYFFEVTGYYSKTRLIKYILLFLTLSVFSLIISFQFTNWLMPYLIIQLIIFTGFSIKDITYFYMRQGRYVFLEKSRL